MLELASYMTPAWAPTLALVIVRVAAMFLVAPVFSHAAVPIRLRVAMAMVVALAVTARMARPVAIPSNVLEALLGVGSEAAIGAIIGYAARLVFVGVQVGALHIGQQMGVALGGVFQPSGEGASGSGAAMLHLLALLIFLAIGGHRELIGALFQSFRSVPLKGFVPGEGTLEMVVGLLAVSFQVALKLAAPVLIALLLAGAAMGFLQKTLPQCHILSTNLPVRVLLGLLVLAAALAAMMAAVEWGWAATGTRITQFLKSGTPK